MTTFIIRRLIQTFFVLILVSIITFLILHMLPGDPARIMLGQDASQEQVDILRHELWLDRPLIVQYFQWLVNVFQGDFGKSMSYHEDVNRLILLHLPVTFYLGLVAMIISVILAIPLGIISAVRRGKVLDSVISVSANMGMAIPIFWLGVLFVYLLSLKLGWLPVQGYTSPFDDLWLSVKKMVMPVICLTVVPLATITRQTRSSMLEVIRQDYIRTARSKGLKQRVIITGHALKNAIIPIVTLLGVQMRYLVGGSVLTESVFNIPGMGRLMVRAVFDKDFLIVQGCIMTVAIVVTLANLAVDISYGYFDPRIRYEE
ncbi:MAG: ABC transporter permease [Deltaproteobacteria bacterium]|nr:ABC transporter permease [Deltaproteobacteria bacterium]